MRKRRVALLAVGGTLAFGVSFGAPPSAFGYAEAHFCNVF
jgi:hypothetical protein